MGSCPMGGQLSLQREHCVDVQAMGPWHVQQPLFGWIAQGKLVDRRGVVP